MKTKQALRYHLLRELVKYYFADFVRKRGHYGLTGRIIKNLKMPKKLRQGAQNSGKIARKLELIKLSASD